jgi:hypothetical protein
MYQIVSNLLNTVLANDPHSVMRLQQAQQCIMMNDTQNASNIVQVTVLIQGNHAGSQKVTAGIGCI